jgi:hypothetical protein
VGHVLRAGRKAEAQLSSAQPREEESGRGVRLPVGDPQ